MESSRHALTLATLVAMLAMLTGCEMVKGIFKAGMWTGVIVVALVAGIMFAVLSRARRV